MATERATDDEVNEDIKAFHWSLVESVKTRPCDPINWFEAMRAALDSRKDK